MQISLFFLFKINCNALDIERGEASKVVIVVLNIVVKAVLKLLNMNSRLGL